MKGIEKSEKFSREDVQEVLGILAKCILENKVEVLNERQGYIDLLENYFLTNSDVRNILLSLSVEDFSGFEYARDDRFKGTLMYKFIPKRDLYSLEKQEEVEVYIYSKFGFIGESAKDITSLIISFHKTKEPKKFYFDV